MLRCEISGWLGLGNLLLGGELSFLSCFVSSVSIGYPIQPIRMAFDFTESQSSLYSDSECPEFINCFDVLTSLASNYRPEDSTVSNHVWMHYGNRVGEFEFLVTSPKQSAKFRDVAGVVAAGPQSDFFSGRCMQLSLQGESRIGFSEVKHPLPEIGWIPSLSDMKWEFAALLFQEPVTVVFNLRGADTESLVLPDGFRTNSYCQRLLGDKTPPSDGWISLESSVSISVVIGSVAVSIAPNKVRFDSSIGEIYIGQFLLSSAERIFLNYGDGTIGIVPSQSNKPPASVPNGPLKLFSAPVTDDSSRRHHWYWTALTLRRRQKTMVPSRSAGFYTEQTPCGSCMSRTLVFSFEDRLNLWIFDKPEKV